MPLEIPITYENGRAKAAMEPMFQDKDGNLTEIN